jgi:Reverse transcriptase (RNA-dependent DNA polymerase)
MFAMLVGVVDHRQSDAALKSSDLDGKVPRTTKGWDLCVEWEDGSTSWVPLRDLKESNPIEVAEYAVARGIDREPAFAWWVPRKRDRIVSLAKSRLVRKTHKFGIELPRSVRHALELDRANGNTYWADAMRKEQAGINPAFDFQEKGGPKPVGYEAIQGHTIFDVKPDLTRKARFVAQGNRTELTVELTYASVASRDSVRIAFLLAALNDMSVLCADVGNAYINTPCRGKYCILCRPEFCPEREGCWAILVPALYGLRTSAASWRTHLYQVLERDLGFTACPADPDVLMRTATRVDGRKYYEYLLVHTDDLLVISEKPQRILDDVDSHFKLKAGSVEAPRKYLGAAISQFSLPQTGQEVWAMSSDDYLREALMN